MTHVREQPAALRVPGGGATDIDATDIDVDVGRGGRGNGPEEPAEENQDDQQVVDLRSSSLQKGANPGTVCSLCARGET